MSVALLTLAQVEARVGRKKSSIYADAKFPKPVKVGSRNRWVESEITAYIEGLIKVRDGVPS